MLSPNMSKGKSVYSCSQDNDTHTFRQSILEGIHGVCTCLYINKCTKCSEAHSPTSTQLAIHCVKWV